LKDPRILADKYWACKLNRLSRGGSDSGRQGTNIGLRIRDQVAAFAVDPKIECYRSEEVWQL
jgi:hypothetical protein